MQQAQSLEPRAKLIVMSGLPGVGKTAVSRELARAIGAVYLRIDSIEQALRVNGVRVEGQGYDVAYAVAADNLRLGRTVVADCVNPWPLTRAAWRSVAERAGVRAVEVEIVCSDEAEHRRRVASRVADIDGHYRPWDSPRLLIDSSRMNVQEAVGAIRNAL